MPFDMAIKLMIKKSSISFQNQNRKQIIDSKPDATSESNYVVEKYRV